MLKKKGPAASVLTGPKRMAKAKRPVNFKQATSKNQYLLLKFDKDHPGLTFDEAGAILAFIRWLEKNDYNILDTKRMVMVRIEAGGGDW